jgi:hypothetical protein
MPVAGCSQAAVPRLEMIMSAANLDSGVWNQGSQAVLLRRGCT